MAKVKPKSVKLGPTKGRPYDTGGKVKKTCKS